ncbi:MAG: DUF3369 domain-containing protein [Desulfovibrio sp.]
MNDDLIFADEQADTTPSKPTSPYIKSWKILIVDDAPEVHDMTKLVLADYSFEGAPLKMFHAYSAEEGRKIMSEENDIAITLLDVVMETSTAGLDMARWIREDLKNNFVRIILRTGQPGEAPEQQVITEYDINDYKEKTDLTAKKLFTTITASLRSYRDIRTIDRSRAGLVQIIKASADLFKIQSIKTLATGVLTQLSSLLGLEDDSLYIQHSGMALMKECNDFTVVAATGKFASDPSNQETTCNNTALTDKVRERIDQALQQEGCIFSEEAYVCYFPTSNNTTNIIYLEGRPLVFTETEIELIKLFSQNVALALENAYFNEKCVCVIDKNAILPKVRPTISK